jgi:hypothetical protein
MCKATQRISTRAMLLTCMMMTHTRDTRWRSKMLTVTYSGTVKMGGKQTIIPEICTGMLITHRTRVDLKKKFTSPVLWDAELIEISKAIGICDRRLNVHGHVIWGICAGMQLWQLNMVTVLENWSHLEVQGFIHFLWTGKVQAAHILWQFIEVYSDVMSGQQVAKGCCTFPSCRDSVMNDNWSGHQSSCMTCQYCTCWDTCLGRCGTLLCMSSDLGLCCGTVQHIVVDVFQYCKVCAIWVVCIMDDIKVARVMTFLIFLQC